MVFQAYLLFFLICTLVCIVILAKNFFYDNLLDQENKPSFWTCWVQFPKHKTLVAEHARSLLVGLYWIQLVTVIILILSAIFGNYTW